jgi:hypothetical protein
MRIGFDASAASTIAAEIQSIQGQAAKATLTLPARRASCVRTADVR